MLYAYPLDELTSPKNSKAPDRLAHEISEPVHFFQTGVCHGVELVVYARQKTVYTIFTALKPIRSIGSESRSRGISLGHRGFFRSHSSKSPWFEDYKVTSTLSSYRKKMMVLINGVFLGILGRSSSCEYPFLEIQICCGVRQGL